MFDEAQRNSGFEQALRRIERQRESHREAICRLRPFGQYLEQAELHAGQQHLRVDEAGDQIEQLARMPARNGSRQREGRGAALKHRAGEQPITPAEQAVEPRAEGSLGVPEQRANACLIQAQSGCD